MKLTNAGLLRQGRGQVADPPLHLHSPHQLCSFCTYLGKSTEQGSRRGPRKLPVWRRRRRSMSPPRAGCRHRARTRRRGNSSVRQTDSTAPLGAGLGHALEAVVAAPPSHSGQSSRVRAAGASAAKVATGRVPQTEGRSRHCSRDASQVMDSLELTTDWN